MVMMMACMDLDTMSEMGEGPAAPKKSGMSYGYTVQVDDDGSPKKKKKDLPSAKGKERELSESDSVKSVVRTPLIYDSYLPACSRLAKI